jgi:hypothetical protein
MFFLLFDEQIEFHTNFDLYMYTEIVLFCMKIKQIVAKLRFPTMMKGIHYIISTIYKLLTVRYSVFPEHTRSHEITPVCSYYMLLIYHHSENSSCICSANALTYYSPDFPLRYKLKYVLHQKPSFTILVVPQAYASPTPRMVELGQYFYQKIQNKPRNKMEYQKISNTS